jgi:hypothetical protein
MIYLSANKLRLENDWSQNIDRLGVSFCFQITKTMTLRFANLQGISVTTASGLAPILLARRPQIKVQ